MTWSPRSAERKGDFSRLTLRTRARFQEQEQVLPTIVRILLSLGFLIVHTNLLECQG